DHSDERGGMFQAVDCSRYGMQHRNRRQHSQSLSTAWAGRPDSGQAVGPSLARHSRVPRGTANSRRDSTPGIGLRFQRLVAGPPERPPGEADRYPFQRRSVGADHASGEILVSTSQAHDEREARRGGLRASWSPVALAQKKAIRDDADEALIFQDEMEIHRHP